MLQYMLELLINNKASGRIACGTVSFPWLEINDILRTADILFSSGSYSSFKIDNWKINRRVTQNKKKSEFSFTSATFRLQ